MTTNPRRIDLAEREAIRSARLAGGVPAKEIAMVHGISLHTVYRILRKEEPAPKAELVKATKTPLKLSIEQRFGRVRKPFRVSDVRAAFPEASEYAIRMALTRLCQAGTVRRIAWGEYSGCVE